MNRIVIVAAIAAVVAGCSTTKSQVEADYGRAVREMINAQVADPRTSTNPSSAPVTGADPDMVNAAVNTLRGTVAEPGDVKKDIVVNIGGQK